MIEAFHRIVGVRSNKYEGEEKLTDEDEEGLKKVQVEKKRKVIIREGEMRFVCIDKFILSID